MGAQAAVRRRAQARAVTTDWLIGSCHWLLLVSRSDFNDWKPPPRALPAVTGGGALGSL